MRGSLSWYLSGDTFDINPNHCHIILSSILIDWGPKPFRFETCWLGNRGFFGLAHSWWNRVDISDSAGFRYCKKLHVLNKSFKGWNRELFGCINNSSVALSKVVEDIDKTKGSSIN